MDFLDSRVSVLDAWNNGHCGAPEVHEALGSLGFRPVVDFLQGSDWQLAPTASLGGPGSYHIDGGFRLYRDISDSSILVAGERRCRLSELAPYLQQLSLQGTTAYLVGIENVTDDDEVSQIYHFKGRRLPSGPIGPISLQAGITFYYTIIKEDGRFERAGSVLEVKMNPLSLYLSGIPDLDFENVVPFLASIPSQAGRSFSIADGKIKSSEVADVLVDNIIRLYEIGKMGDIRLVTAKEKVYGRS
ncbi:hypothetical protein COV20_02375 [Candidatus Woesearchaeota archaeon CG10_big_fil_rev_8_21_14_0_10_45_16]|nr:MAG: hypothetical protein COV20_02375 [Candidatus Woesearchaeota archaeon CG10_big_fil_rev_8_21_14_0_10_45_16]